MMRTIKIIAMAALGAIVLTGCASTSVTKVAKAAPITYKFSDKGVQHASVTRPTMPRVAPQPYTPPSPIARPQAKTFDQASVDPDLYKHQKVGRRYTIMGKSYTPNHQPNYDVTGVASWYGDKFHGKPTATGEKFDKNALTAAHKTLPLNSMLFVTNLENGKTLMVRLNDRGPFIGDRIIDLSQASAKALGIGSQGLGKVRVQYAGPADPMAAYGRAPVRPAAPIPFPEENIVEAVPTVPAPAMPFKRSPALNPDAAPAPYVPGPVSPQAPQAVPGAKAEPDGQITLTIKGPVHVASHTSGQNEPEWVTGAVQTR